MNLLTNLRNRFGRAGVRKPAGKPAENQTFNQLLLNLQQVCAGVPDGEAFVTLDRGEFAIRMTWNSEKDTGRQRLMFSLNGKGEAVEWTEQRPDGVDDSRVRILPCPKKEPVSSKERQGLSGEKPSKQQQMMRQLVRYLRLNYAFRYNRLADRTECARLDAENLNDSHHLFYTPVDNRTLNSIALDAINEGIECWDRDVKRYIESEHVPAYHPFALYFEHLPEWDGKDRVTDLARRVSDSPLWIRGFHRWMLASTARWANFDAESQRPNSVAPLLVSTRQGLGKSTFCRMLLPKPLRDYFTESFDLTHAGGAENKLASYGLINLDEFDRIPATRMSLLKNLMQMESLRVRRAYKRNAEPLPRIASFIGTSNRTDLLTDLSGSRRFICVEITKPIDCTTPIAYEQLYAQLKHELQNGERYWFSKEEEAAIQEANKAFYRVTPAEELISSCFRFAEPGEEGARLMSAAGIYAALKRKNPAVLRDCSCMGFSRLMAQVGRRVHTRYGNGYWVKPASSFDAPSALE